MNYIILILIAVICCFAVCFESQLYSENDYKVSKKFKLFLPQNKENTVMFIIIMLMLILAGVFLEYIYSNAILENIKLLLILAILCPAAYTDWKDHVIQNKLILSAVCLRILIYIIEVINNPAAALSIGMSAAISATAIFIIGFLSALIFKSGVGMGDIKLMSVMALYQGASGVVCSIVISLIVSFVYCVVALIGKKKSKKDVIPFAPSLLMGTYISILLFGI